MDARQVLIEIAALRRELLQLRSLVRAPIEVGRRRPEESYWLRLKDYDGEPGPNTYTVDVYLSPFDDTPVETDRMAWNSWEIGNDSSHGSSYVFVSGTPQCADIVGVEPLPMGSWHKALDYKKNGSDWGYLFSVRQDPIYDLEEDE